MEAVRVRLQTQISSFCFDENSKRVTAGVQILAVYLSFHLLASSQHINPQYA